MHSKTGYPSRPAILREHILTCLNPEYPITEDPTDGSGPCMHLDVFLLFVSLSKIDLNGVDYALARRAMADGREGLVESVADFYSQTYVGRELIQRGRRMGFKDLNTRDTTDSPN